MHKCINKLVPDYRADMFKSRSQFHNRQTRSSGALDIPLCRLSTRQRSFAFRGAKLWNSLNDNIKSLKCPRNFRRHLANVLLSWYIFCNDNMIVLTFLINLYKFVVFILLSWKAHLGSINKVYVCIFKPDLMFSSLKNYLPQTRLAVWYFLVLFFFILEITSVYL